MSRIVNGEAVEQHIITEYKFKSFDEEEKVEPTPKEEVSTQNPQPQQSTTPKEDSKYLETIEKLLSKIEELSNNIVSIQTQFEKQLNECKAQIEIEKKKAYEEGYKKGQEDAANALSNELQEKLKLLEQSIKKIDNINEIFEEKILSIEKELISVALDIAKEVIQKEVSENSQEIAYNLAKSLMEDIKDATKIKLKVNPKDAEFLKGKFENVEIVEDDAVKEGGVVVVSDIGNIDAQILERFKTIKEAVLEGNE